MGLQGLGRVGVAVRLGFQGVRWGWEQGVGVAVRGSYGGGVGSAGGRVGVGDAMGIGGGYNFDTGSRHYTERRNVSFSISRLILGRQGMEGTTSSMVSYLVSTRKNISM